MELTRPFVPPLTPRVDVPLLAVAAGFGAGVGWVGSAGSVLASAAAVALAGAAMAGLAQAWWGGRAGPLLAAVVWSFTLAPLARSGDVGGLGALALLPVAWGVALRGVVAGGASLVGALGLLVVVRGLSATESRALLVLYAAAIGVVARGPEARVRLARVAGLGFVSLVVLAPALALRAGDAGAPGAELVAPVGVVAGAAGLLAAGRRPARALLPAMAVLGGLGPVGGSAAAGFGLALLAGGAGEWGERLRLRRALVRRAG